MKERNIYTPQDIERLSSQGFTRIQIDKYDMVAPVAKERAKRLGVAILFSTAKASRASTKPSSPAPSGETSSEGLQLRLFLDSADVEEIRKAVKSGVVAGLAMNPGKIAQTKLPLSEIVTETREFLMVRCLCKE